MSFARLSFACRVFAFPAAAAAFFSAFLGAANAQPDIPTPAEFAVIMDYETGAVLFDKNGGVPTAPASMSKLMTVAIVFEALQKGELSLDDQFAVSEKAWRMQGSKMWVRVDTEIALADLLRGVVVQSGNDACIVIAENVSGSEDAFAQLMNRKAREWGLLNSTFANATGWPDPGQKMSMRDLATLTRKIIRDYGEYYTLFAEKEFTWEKIRQSNRNPLLTTFDGADGLKTGHTEESGYGLVGSAERGGARRILVVNGLTSERERVSETRRLMRIAFNDFSDQEIFPKNAVVGRALTFKGRQETVPLMTDQAISVMLHRSAIDTVKSTVVYEGPVTAPIKQNQQIGFLRIEVDGAAPREYPLFAGEAVREIGAFGKVMLAATSLLAKPAPAPEE